MSSPKRGGTFASHHEKKWPLPYGAEQNVEDDAAARDPQVLALGRADATLLEEDAGERHVGRTTTDDRCFYGAVEVLRRGCEVL